MAWCHQAPSHNLIQCWHRWLLPYGIIRPQWFNSYTPSAAYVTLGTLMTSAVYLFHTAERMLRTIIMQNSRLIQTCSPSKIVEVWINRFCIGYHWWRRLQPTSSGSPVWYMHQWTGSALIQSMACHLFGSKPLPGPMLTYCQLDP